MELKDEQGHSSKLGHFVNDWAPNTTMVVAVPVYLMLMQSRDSANWMKALIDNTHVAGVKEKGLFVWGSNPVLRVGIPEPKIENDMMDEASYAQVTDIARSLTQKAHVALDKQVNLSFEGRDSNGLSRDHDFLPMRKRWLDKHPDGKNVHPEHRNGCDLVEWIELAFALSLGMSDCLVMPKELSLVSLIDGDAWTEGLQQLHLRFSTHGLREQIKEAVFPAYRALDHALFAVDRFCFSHAHQLALNARASYLNHLPMWLTSVEHQARKEKALAWFDSKASGEALEVVRGLLSRNMDEIWNQGHRRCDAVSVLGRYCMLAVVGDDHGGRVHSTGYRAKHSCMCGQTVSQREDSFDYSLLNGGVKCSPFFRDACCEAAAILEAEFKIGAAVERTNNSSEFGSSGWG